MKGEGDKPFAENSTEIMNIFLAFTGGAIFFNPIKTVHLKSLCMRTA